MERLKTVVFMNKTEWYELAKHARAAFKVKDFLENDRKCDIWLEYVKFMDFKIAKHAMKNFILTSKYPPSISEYIEMYNSLVDKSKDANLQIKMIYKNMESYYPMCLRDDEAKQTFIDTIKDDNPEKAIENAMTISNGIISCVKSMEKKGRDDLPTLSKCIRECKDYVDKQNK